MSHHAAAALLPTEATKWSRARAFVWKRASGRCWYCGVKLRPSDFHQDHVVPRSRGGLDGLNVVPTCTACNLRKGPRDLEEFRALEERRLQQLPLWEQDATPL